MTVRKPVSPSPSQRSPPLQWLSAPHSISKPLPKLPIDDAGSKSVPLGDEPIQAQDASNVWSEEQTVKRMEGHMHQPPQHAIQLEMAARSVLGQNLGSVQPQLMNLTPRTSTDSQRSLQHTTSTPPLQDTCQTTSNAQYLPSSNNPFRRAPVEAPAHPIHVVSEGHSSAEVWGSSELPAGREVKKVPPFLEFRPSSDAWGDFASAPTATQDVWSKEKPKSHDPPSLQKTYSNGLEDFQEVPSRSEVSEGIKKVSGTSPDTEAFCPDVQSHQQAQVPHSFASQQIDAVQLVQALPPSPPPRQTSPTASVSLTGPHIPPQEIDQPVAQSRPRESPTPRRAGETYQIRLIHWYDASSIPNMRKSPIMVQNANGPCPLLALVNALVLSTPSDLETALVETLRVREQVSLGLLLDAVIDELMSGRRGNAAQDLPDVSELYAFLVTLHTGMNVNPRFVPDEEEPINLMDAPIDLPTNFNDLRKPGGFEDTKEMKLYSTFSVPLIHGWIPPRNHPAFAALKRTATTYEDAQNLMFMEEELEERLKRQGLTAEQQLVLEDVASVKYYLSSTATQLTGYGLDTISESLDPGAISILFRNDHFSTLYRHPKSGQLLTLVTDMGYAGHDEVVWESLVDVTGEGCGFFAGDFRPVGNVAGDIHPSNNADAEGWETVNSKRRRKHHKHGHSHGNKGSTPSASSLGNLTLEETSLSANTEQEDHDLALAMQLQEEEEDRQRRSAAARRREDELSQAYLNNADASGRRTFPSFGRGATGGNPQVPPRGGSGGSSATLIVGGNRAGSARQAPRRQQSDSEDAPPPSYEQAAKGPAYHPPADHPAHPHASPSPPAIARPQIERLRVRSSAYTEHVASAYGGTMNPVPAEMGQRSRGRRSNGAVERDGVPPGVMRRRTGDKVGLPLQEKEAKDKDCVVM